MLIIHPKDLRIDGEPCYELSSRFDCYETDVKKKESSPVSHIFTDIFLQQTLIVNMPGQREAGLKETRKAGLFRAIPQPRFEPQL